MFKFEELRVYKQSLILTDAIYKATKKWPKEETYSLTDQLRRATISISLNIAEGSSRAHKDFEHFLSISRGSCYECAAIISIAKNQGFLTQDEYEKFYSDYENISRSLTALKKAIRARGMEYNN